MAAFLPVSEIAQVSRQLADTYGATERLHAIHAEAPVMQVTLVSPPERSAPKQAPRREITRERRVEATTRSSLS